MKKLVRLVRFYFDYYIGYHLYSKGKDWSRYIIKKYPEQFPREVEYLEQLEEDL